jgi:putative ATP-dependent DNA ligase
MDLEGVAAALGLGPERIKGALTRKTIHSVKDPHTPYIVFKKDLGKVQRGTAVFLGDDILVVRGFPKIRRGFFLGPIIKKNFADEVAVEEKMNGYNVRVFREGERILAVTRGGYICPFTTKKLAPILEDFLSDNDLVVCGEVVGSENPYVSHDYPDVEGFGFFSFDLREKGTGRPKGVLERNELLKGSGVRSVPLFGIFSKKECPGKVFEIVREISKEKREGVVLKDPGMDRDPVKYTSTQTNTQDLAYAFTFPFDYGRDFSYSRIMREGFQAVEWDVTPEELEERAHRLGESILYPMVRSMRRVKEGVEVTEDHIIRVKDLDELEEIMAYLGRMGVECIIGDVWDDEGILVVQIKRLMHRTNDKIKHNLGM